MKFSHNTDIPLFEFSRINPCLLAGRNPLTADDVELLVSEGVTHFLDLREPVEWLAPRLGTEALEEIERRKLFRCHIPIIDGCAPTRKEFDQCAALQELTQQKPQTQVYIHCRAGMGRTAAILIAWVARQEGNSYEQVFWRLKLQRPVLSPLPGQEQATRRWLESQRNIT